MKEILDNCIDEYVMGYGHRIDVTIREKWSLSGTWTGCRPAKDRLCFKINTGAKYDSKVFKKQ
jgi:topoisomerase-4 subunit B